MTLKEYAYAAIDIVIDLAAEQGIKYRRGDFRIEGIDKAKGFGLNNVYFIGGINEPSGVSVNLWYDFARTGKKLKAAKNGFYSYKYCRVKENCVSFNFSLNEIEIQSVKETTAEYRGRISAWKLK